MDKFSTSSKVPQAPQLHLFDVTENEKARYIVQLRQASDRSLAAQLRSAKRKGRLHEIALIEAEQARRVRS